MNRCTLSKAERVWQQKDIDLLFMRGGSFFLYPYKLVWAERPREGNESSLRMMVSVGKKRFKRAVHRNRIKRQTREIYRLNKLPLKALTDQRAESTLLLGLLYIGKESFEYASMEKKILELLNRLQMQLDRRSLKECDPQISTTSE